MSAPKKRWENLAQDYHRATGVSCRILYLNQAWENLCPICSELKEKLGRSSGCSGVHLFSAYQAERWGGRYIYLCPMSGLYWSSPLMSGGMMIGAAIAGPVLLNGLDPVTMDGIVNRFALEPADAGKLSRLYDDLAEVGPERAQSLSSVLYSMAMNASDRDDTRIFDDQEAFQHQSKIGEYLHLLKSMEGDKNSDLDYPLDLEKKLLNAVARGEKGRAQDILDELLARVMYASGVNLDVIRSRVLELVVLISRAALEGGADVEQIFGLNYRYLNDVRDCTDPEELSQWLRRIIERFGDLVFDLKEVKHTDTILRGLRFIKENFYEKITLGDLAGQLELSSDYLGSLFRKELGMSFSDYIARTRVEEAKRLLKSGTSSLGDIAYACGFEDHSYFTKVFRKVTGTTPSRYRDSDKVFLADSYT